MWPYLFLSHLVLSTNEVEIRERTVTSSDAENHLVTFFLQGGGPGHQIFFNRLCLVDCVNISQFLIWLATIYIHLHFWRWKAEFWTRFTFEKELIRFFT